MPREDFIDRDMAFTRDGQPSGTLVLKSLDTSTPVGFLVGELLSAQGGPFLWGNFLDMPGVYPICFAVWNDGNPLMRVASSSAHRPTPQVDFSSGVFTVYVGFAVEKPGATSLLEGNYTSKTFGNGIITAQGEGSWMAET